MQARQMRPSEDTEPVTLQFFRVPHDPKEKEKEKITKK